MPRLACLVMDIGDINTVQQNLAAGGLVDTGNDFGQRGFAAAVGAGDGYKTLLYGKADDSADFYCRRSYNRRYAS